MCAISDNSSSSYHFVAFLYNVQVVGFSPYLTPVFYFTIPPGLY